MIMKVFGWIFGFTMLCCAIVLFACVAMIGLACFDYLCDSDMKGYLVSQLGERPLLKNIRKNAIDFTKKHDNPSKEDLMTASDEEYRRYRYGIEQQDDEAFEKSIHDEIEKIFKDAKDDRTS